MFNRSGSCLIAVVTLLSSAFAAPGRGSDVVSNNAAQHDVVLKIRVIDLAAVPSRDWMKTQHELAQIFSTAGPTLEWEHVIGRKEVPLLVNFSSGSVTPAGCRDSREDSVIKIRLLPHAPRTLPVSLLGFSLPCVSAGIDATIYVDHCELVAFGYPVSFQKVLACAIAHELGHVLLGSAQHSSTGLMCARWDRTQWLSAAARTVTLNEHEVQVLRQSLPRFSLPAPLLASR